MALGALRQLDTRGVRVPADVSVTGFDDIQEAAYFHPPLTTIRIDFARQGAFIFGSLLAEIKDEEAPDRDMFLRPELIIRESTGAPRP